MGPLSRGGAAFGDADFEAPLNPHPTSTEREDERAEKWHDGIAGGVVSLYSVMAYTLLTVTTFTISLPTCRQAISSLGGTPLLSGALMGFMPLASGFVQLPLLFVLKRVPLRTVLLTFCVVLCASQVLYGLAGWLGSPVALLASRAISGLVSGPQLITTYVARAVSIQQRSKVCICSMNAQRRSLLLAISLTTLLLTTCSKVMMRVGVAFTGGYALGTLIPTALAAVQIVEHQTGTLPGAKASLLALVSPDSLPGWVIALLAAIEFVFLLYAFREPPHAAAVDIERVGPGPGSGPEPGVTSRKVTAPLAAGIFYIGAIACNIGAWEVFTSNYTQLHWGWAVWEASLYLFANLFFVVPINLLNFPALFSDRAGMLAFMGLGVTSQALFFGLSAGPETLQVGLYSLGSLVFVACMQIARNFTWAFVTKIPRTKDRQLVLGINATVYMGAKGIGAIVSPFLKTNEVHTAAFLALNLLGLSIAAYKCKPPEQQPSQLAEARHVSEARAAAQASGTFGTLPLEEGEEGEEGEKGEENKPPERPAYVMGTGAAFGNHYSTEQMLAAFHAQRACAGDSEYDRDFADRVFNKCGFDAHSVALPPEDLFRTFTRDEYLQHRATNLVDLAARAAEQALAHWGGDRSQITHLLWGTMTGGMDSPTIDITLVSRLGLSPDVQRTSIEGMGCLTSLRLLNLAQQVQRDDV